MEAMETPAKPKGIEGKIESNGGASTFSEEGSQTVEEKRKPGSPRLSVHKVHLTPEIIARLRRVTRHCLRAEYVKNSHGNEEQTKDGQEGQRNGKIEVKELTHEKSNFIADETTDLNGPDTVSQLLLPSSVPKEQETERATSDNTEGNMELKTKTDEEIFHKVLKDAVEKRTNAIEEVLMKEVNELKKKVYELETQKKGLQSDAKRLQLMLTQISSKHGKAEVQTVSCGAQTDPAKLMNGQSPSSKFGSQTALPGQTRIAAHGSHQSLAQRNYEHQQSLPASQASDFDIQNSRSQSIEKHQVGHVATTFAPGTKTAGSSQQTSVPPPLSPLSHCVQTKAYKQSDEYAARRESPSSQQQMPPPLLHHQAQLSPVEVLAAAQERRSQQFATGSRVPPYSQIVHQPPFRPRSQEIPVVSRLSPGQLPQQPTTESTRLQQSYLRPQGITPPPQQHNQLQTQFSQYQGAKDAQIHTASSIPGFVSQSRSSNMLDPKNRGPPNVTVLGPSKKQRVEPFVTFNQDSVTFGDGNCVMGKFKLQPTPWRPKVQDNTPHPQAKAVSTAGRQTQAVRNSPPSQPPEAFTGQVATNQPVIHHDSLPFRVPQMALHSRPGVSPGLMGERVNYQSTPNQTVNGPSDTRVSNINQRETTYTSNQSFNRVTTAVSTPRFAPAQPITRPANTPTQVRPQVQSPGISSTGSLSGRHAGGLNPAGHNIRMNHEQQNSSVVGGDVSQIHSNGGLQSPPKPSASIVVVQDGIVLSWNMQLDNTMAKIDNYELFACQDGAESNTPPILWKKIGIVKALPLPMACTLTQFSSGNKYYFAVRAVDEHERAGPFSDPCTISLT